MSICLTAGGKIATLAATAFTLAWTHSVEKTRWEEDWRLLADGRLAIVEARVKGSGAGMEPPEGAVLDDGWWTYRPALAPQSELVLAASGATDSGWRICFGTTCLDVGSAPDAPAVLRPCEAD